MENNLGIKVPDDRHEELVNGILAQTNTFKVEEPVVEKWTFFDTFDWRLYKKSLTLRLSDQELYLLDLKGRDSIARIQLTTMPVYARDFPAGTLTNMISTFIGVRAVLMVAEVHTQSRVYRILNKDEKTVARLVSTEVRTAPDIDSPLTASYLSLRPVRGYPKYARQLEQALTEIGETYSIIEDIYLSAIQKARIKIGGYSSRLDLQLDPHQRSDGALKVIFQRLLKIMKANEAGIKADVDTEFLHDYRIAIRRTRSALGQIKNVFPPEETSRFKRDFATLGRVSNHLRDLDVYLLSEDNYCAMLPEAMRDDILPLFDYLRTQRGQALDNVGRTLNSNAYAHFLNEWQFFLNEPVPETSAETNAQVPIIDLAGQRIYKQYRNVIKDGTYLLEHTQDGLLHLLRIECKKLRYLMELFISLFPQKDIRRLINHLKVLQDNLGEFNDLSVQQEHLMQLAKELPVNNERSKMALVATGYLVETMARRQRIVKADFSRTFKDFTSPGNQKQYRELFSGKIKRYTQ